MQVFCGTCEHGAASLLLSPVSGKVSLVAKVPSRRRNGGGGDGTRIVGNTSGKQLALYGGLIPHVGPRKYFRLVLRGSCHHVLVGAYGPVGLSMRVVWFWSVQRWSISTG